MNLQEARDKYRNTIKTNRTLYEEADAAAPLIRALEIHVKRLEERIQNMTDHISDLQETAHPWWGPCDGFAPHGQCSECKRVQMAWNAEKEVSSVWVNRAGLSVFEYKWSVECSPRVRFLTVTRQQARELRIRLMENSENSGFSFTVRKLPKPIKGNILADAHYEPIWFAPTPF